MPTENDQGNGAGTYAADGLRVIAGIILFPFLWIGVGLNFLGVAERLSFLPGVSEKGGIVSGTIAFVMTVLVLGLLVGGSSAALSAGIPVIGSEDEATPTQTATATPTPTPTETATSTATSTPTPKLSDYEAFKADYRQRLNGTVQNETLTDVSVLAMEYQETDNGVTELWLVYQQCDYAEEVGEQRFTVGADFANTAGNSEGDQPDRLRAYGVSNLETYPDRITHISTQSAEKVHNRTIEVSTYSENWNGRLREPKDAEEETAFQMTVDESGRSTAEKAFNEHYTVEERDETCPDP